ncbi:YsnF/AvaK domain-containing protein [uncultured Sphingomonas sp.]|uniref:YsnF/AvaK domain-containing protein n=1 Tax=uncultured Sphingomonas sp. TaxID=158754 RepID=UPI0035CA50AA
MTRTITALFDRRADAEAAETRLKAASVDAGHISIHDQSSAGFHATGASSAQDPGIWGSIKHAFVPDEDRHTYEEGIRRGGFLLTADVDDTNVDAAVRVLEESDSIDVDDRSQEWRSSGWSHASESAVGAGAGTAAHGERDRLGGGAIGTDGEQSIPIVEESLVVGKREVDRGGARVRSYVTETPVHEQVRLRDEQIDVQRRAVDRPVTDADDAFRERSIDVTATGEEAVVGKTARVVEEVVVSKTAGERVEEIDDTVLRTDVEIDRSRGSDADPAYRR